MIILNNKGFTLVEMMIVIAVIAVAIVGIITSTAVISSSNARKAANSFISLMGECRVNTTTGAQGVSIEITQNEGQLIANITKKSSTNETIEREEILCESDVQFEFLDDNDKEITVKSITFNRETGALHEPSELDRVVFKGGNREYVVKIHASTGYFEIE